MGSQSSNKQQNAEEKGSYNARTSIMWVSLFVLFVSGIVPFLVGATKGSFYLEGYMKACVLGPKDTELYSVYTKLNEATIDQGVYEFYLANWKCAATQCDSDAPYDAIPACSEVIHSEVIRNNTKSSVANRAYLNRGTAYMKEGNYYEAISDFSKLIEIDQNANAYYRRAEAYRRGDQYDEAIADYDKAIEIDKGHAPAYVGRGILKEGKGHYHSALSDFDKAIEIDSRNAGYCNRYLLTPSTAEPEGDPRCVASAWRDFLAYSYRGVAYLYNCDHDDANKSDYDAAIANFDKAIEIDPKNALVYNYQGIANEMKGEQDKAIKDFDKAIEIDPDSADAYYYRGVAYGMNGDPVNAIEDFDKTIEIDPDSADAYSGRGAAYLKQGYYDKAIADYDEVIKIDPMNATAYFNRGNAYENLGRKTEAIADYGSVWLSRDKDARDALTRLGSPPPNANNNETLGEFVGVATDDSIHQQVGCTKKWERGPRRFNYGDVANIVHNGLGEINEDYRGAHQFFNDDMVGSLLEGYNRAVLWPFFRSGIHFGATTAVRYYETNRIVRTCFILIYFLVFFSTYELGKHIFSEVFQKRLVPVLKGFGEHLFYEALEKEFFGPRSLPVTALRKIITTFELGRHISYELLRKTLERLIGWLR